MVKGPGSDGFTCEFHTVKDLVDQNLDFLTYMYEEFQLRYKLQTNFLTYYGLINAIPQEYKKAIKQTSVLQEHLTQPWENLKMLTTKVIHKSFVEHIFEEPTVKQRLIANGLPLDQISKYFNLAFSITSETKLTMFQYKTLHDIVFTENKLFKAKLASSDLCYIVFMLKNKTRSKAYACFMSGGNRVLENFSGMVPFPWVLRE